MHMPNAPASRVKGHWRHRRALLTESMAPPNMPTFRRYAVVVFLFVG